MRRSFLVAVVTAAFTFFLAFSASALATGSLFQISSDPFTDSTGQHKTQVEPDTFAWGKTWISVFQSGRIFSGGASNIGYAVSHDAGTTFTHGFLPGTTLYATPAGRYLAVSDPSVAYDARHGVWMVSYLAIAPGDKGRVDVLVSRSTDGGKTWGAPVAVAVTGDFFDKNWSVCDNTATSPFYGHCYTEFDDVNSGDLEQMSTSTDGGLTWGARQATADKVHGLGGQPVVQPNGTVIVPFQGFSDTSYFVKAFMSTNGGASWNTSVIVSEIRYHPPMGELRAPALPSAEIDAQGRVYVTWPDCRFEAGCTSAISPNSAGDLVLSTSTNGLLWSTPTRIPLDPVGSGVDHFLPGLGVDRFTSGRGARLALMYYYYPNAVCQTATCQLDVGFSLSGDGGASWTPGARIAGPMHLTWLPLTSQGYMVGDYFSTSFVEGTPYPAFAVASPPTNGGASCFTATPNCDQAMFTIKGGLSSAPTSGATAARSVRLRAGRPRIVRLRAGHAQIGRPTAH